MRPWGEFSGSRQIQQFVALEFDDEGRARTRVCGRLSDCVRCAERHGDGQQGRSCYSSPHVARFPLLTRGSACGSRLPRRGGSGEESLMTARWRKLDRDVNFIRGRGDALLCSAVERRSRVFHEGLTSSRRYSHEPRVRLRSPRAPRRRTGATRRAPTRARGVYPLLSLALSLALQLTTTLAPATGWTARREPTSRRRRTRPSRPTPPTPAVSAPAARTRPSSSAAVDAPAPSAYPRRTRDEPPRARCASRARGRRRRRRRGYRRRRPEA